MARYISSGLPSLESAKNYSTSVVTTVTNAVHNVKQKVYDIYYEQHSGDQAEERRRTVLLKPFKFDANQIDKSNAKLTDDGLIATRIGPDFRFAFVYLGKTLKANKFFLVQVLEVDHLQVGGPKLYIEDKSCGERRLLFADSRCEPHDYLIFWMDKKGKLFCTKDGTTQSFDNIEPHEFEKHKLLYEMYGPVRQIRAFVGRLKKENEDTVTELGTDVAASCSEEFNGNTDNSNSQLAGPVEAKSSVITLSLIIRYKHSKGKITVLTVDNLQADTPSTFPSPAIDSSTEGISNAVETCGICMSEDADTVIIPCGHVNCCYECASRIATRSSTGCSLCRAEIQDYHKIFSRSAKCKNCLISSANVVLLPCGDMCLCDLCSTDVKKCPVCQMFVNGRIKIEGQN